MQKKEALLGFNQKRKSNTFSVLLKFIFYSELSCL